jgi:hypothetical protein
MHRILKAAAAVGVAPLIGRGPASRLGPGSAWGVVLETDVRELGGVPVRREGAHQAAEQAMELLPL